MSKKNRKSEQRIGADKTQIPSAKQSIPTAIATTRPHFWLNTKLQAALIFAFAVLLYANTLTHDFCQDDAIVITDNMFTTQGFSGISDILKYDTFYGFFKEAGKESLVAGGRYRPFTLVMFAVEYELFGKNAFAGHLFNVLWFGLLCALLYFLILKLLKYSKNTEGGYSAEMIAFITALIFAAHPIHTEAVANIKGRDEIITLLSSLSAVWFSLKAFERGGILKPVLAGLLFFIALLAKENAITFVLIVPLIYWFFIKTNWQIALKQTIPFIIAAVLFLILRGAIIGNQFTGEQNELMNNPYLKLVGNQYVPFELGEKLATIIYTLGKYIQLLIFPHPLTHDYYPRHINMMHFSDGSVILSLLVYAGLIVLMLKNWQSRSLISFGIAFFLITLSIVSNIVFPVGTNMAERFIFMPSVGFCLVLAVILVKIQKNTEGGLNWQLGIASVIVLLFSIKTFTRNFDWKDNYTIFTTDVNVSKNSSKLQCSAGGSMLEKAQTLTDKTQKTAMIEAAIGHLTRSLEIHPTYKNPYLLRGNAYIYLKNYEKAISEYEAALKLDPNFKDAKTNIALAYREIGLNYGQVKNDLPHAIENLTRSLDFNPNDGGTLSFLGTAYGMSQQPQKAIDVLERALALRFDKQDAINLVVSYRMMGNTAKADEWDKKVQAVK